MAGFGHIDADVEVNNNNGGGGSVTIIPDDDYELEFTELDIVPNSGGTGQNLNGKVQVVSGPHKGVWFFSGITSIQHQSAQAQQIAQGTLKALCLAADVPFPPEDTGQFLYKSFGARVGSETYFSKKHQKDMTKNVVLKYLYDGMPEDDAPAPPVAKREATPPPREEPKAAGRKPWQK